jgi:hypothetical protein
MAPSATGTSFKALSTFHGETASESLVLRSLVPNRNTAVLDGGTAVFFGCGAVVYGEGMLRGGLVEVVYTVGGVLLGVALAG